MPTEKPLLDLDPVCRRVFQKNFFLFKEPLKREFHDHGKKRRRRIPQQKSQRQQESQEHFEFQMAGRFAKMAANLLASSARCSAAKLCTQNSAATQRTKLTNVLAAPHRLFAAPLTSSSSAPHLRAFSVSASSSDRVSSVVAEELKYEQDNYTKPEVQQFHSSTPS